MFHNANQIEDGFGLKPGDNQGRYYGKGDAQNHNGKQVGKNNDRVIL